MSAYCAKCDVFAEEGAQKCWVCGGVVEHHKTIAWTSPHVKNQSRDYAHLSGRVMKFDAKTDTI